MHIVEIKFIDLLTNNFQHFSHKYIRNSSYKYCLREPTNPKFNLSLIRILRDDIDKHVKGFSTKTFEAYIL
jgi:hypothetical protein